MRCSPSTAAASRNGGTRTTSGGGGVTGELPLTSVAGPSHRHVADLGDPHGVAGFVLPAGQSGIPFSRHYRDQFDAGAGTVGLEAGYAPGSHRMRRVERVNETRDLVVVGAGPCGLAVAIAARRAGLSCVVYDKGCVVRGITCYPTHLTFFSTAEKLELGGLPFIVAGNNPTRTEALKYYRRVVDHFELDVRQYEEVLGVERRSDGFVVRSGRRGGVESLTAAGAVVVATGYFDSPNRLHVPGEELAKVTHHYGEAHPYYDQDCVVVGGGNSAVEAALDLYRVRARVTLVHFADRLDPGVKPWILPDITNRLEQGEIAVRWRARVAAIEPDVVLLREEDTGATEALPNDWVLAMTGYTPDHRLLRELDVGIDPESAVPHHDPGTMETDVPGVFIAGVIAAGRNANKIFIENGREHGGRIIGALSATTRP
jgi:thioredoxin reductase (NADPH)